MPSEGLCPTSFAPRSISGSWAPARIASEPDAKTPSQSVITPIRTVRSRPPQPAASRAAAATSARPAALARIADHPGGSVAERQVARALPHVNRPDDAIRARVDLADRAVEIACDPDGTAADGDTRRARGHVDPGGDPTGGIEPDDRVPDLVRDPDAAQADGHVHRDEVQLVDLGDPGHARV